MPPGGSMIPWKQESQLSPSLSSVLQDESAREDTVSGPSDFIEFNFSSSKLLVVRLHVGIHRKREYFIYCFPRLSLGFRPGIPDQILDKQFLVTAFKRLESPLCS